LLNKAVNVKVCDATMFNSIVKAGIKKLNLIPLYKLRYLKYCIFCPVHWMQ
jgi:hypothetical protein